jgi:hypothetical protein
MVHAFDPHAAPDSEYEAGRLELIVPGNRGRLLDPRRTPVSLIALDIESGQFHVRIEGFEDKGAVWEVPLERVDCYQFALASARAEPGAVSAMRAAIERFDRPLVIACDSKRREQTLADLRRRTAAATEWLWRESRFLRTGVAPDFTKRSGPPELAEDLRRFAQERGPPSPDDG